MVSNKLNLTIDNHVTNSELSDRLKEGTIITLSMPMNSTIHDGTIEKMVDLEYLDLGFSRQSKVTMESIVPLCKGGNLKKINLTNNSNFSYDDVMKLIDMGLDVEHNYHWPTSMW